MQPPNPMGFFIAKKMGFKEKDLEGMIYKSMLSKKGFKALRRLKLSTHNHINKPILVFKQPTIEGAGRADLVCVFRKMGKVRHEITVVVYEFKNNRVALEVSEQCKRYIAGIESFICSRFSDKEFDVSVCGVIVGTNFCYSHWKSIPNFDSVVTCQSFEMDITGIKFNSVSGYYAKPFTLDF